MRKQLALAEGERKKFRAQFSRFGKKINYKGHSEETILLKGIVDVETNDVVADHLWFSLTKSFEKLVLKEGMLVEFEARVKIYKKGYVNSRYKIDNSKKDFKLSHPTKIKVIPQNE
jgi:hypothetical protein